MNQGFVIVAQNTTMTNYVACAEILAQNIRALMPDQSVSIITHDQCNHKLFDHVIKLPYGDQAKHSNWKLINDWQVYEASPYEYTLKIEADFYLPRKIDHWFDILKNRELNICTNVRNYKGALSTNNAYRKIFVENKLPQTYNALTYFKKTERAKEFFNIVKTIFENWQQVKSGLRYCPDERPTTDVVYGIAATYIGEEHCTLPTFSDMSFVHMKKAINELRTNQWPDELVYEVHPDTFRIATFSQLYPVHYYVKSFSNQLKSKLNYE